MQKVSGRLFQADMVCALLNDTKLETRRLGWGDVNVGDLIYVREAWAAHWMYDDVSPSAIPSDGESLIHYPADGYVTGHAMGADHFRKRRPSIHMPRWMSRITLLITEHRNERLQEISAASAIAEGVNMDVDALSEFDRNYYLSLLKMGFAPQVAMYAVLWEQINGTGTWMHNPLVNVFRFKVIKQNVDAYLQTLAA